MSDQRATGHHAFPLLFTVASVAMTSLTFGIGRYAYGLFLPAIRQDFGLTTAELGLIASLGTVVYLAVNVVASAVAVRFKPRTLIVTAGAITSLGLAIVGCAGSAPVAITGIVMAGTGAGLYSPAAFEAIAAWLPPLWSGRAIGAVNAGATPGLVLTGLTAFWLQRSWQAAWLCFASLGLLVTLLHAWLLPSAGVGTAGGKTRLPLTLGLFIRPACIPLYACLLAYGLLFSVYLTFAVDMIVTAGGIRFPTDRLFWVLLGMAGLPALFTGPAITRFGVRALLLASMPTCALAFVLLALAPGNGIVVLISAILFGASSVAPGNGFLVWSIGLFRERPSVGSGVVFFVQSLTVIAGPTLCGSLAERVGLPAMFLVVAAISLMVMPLFPARLFGTEPAPVV